MEAVVRTFRNGVIMWWRRKYCGMRGPWKYACSSRFVGRYALRISLVVWYALLLENYAGQRTMSCFCISDFRDLTAVLFGRVELVASGGIEMRFVARPPYSALPSLRRQLCYGDSCACISSTLRYFLRLLWLPRVFGGTNWMTMGKIVLGMKSSRTTNIMQPFDVEHTALEKQ